MNMTRKFTGWHAFGIFVAFFGTVGTVNFTMAKFATSTFGGVVVENTYVASQSFNDWLEAAEASKALGWYAETSRTDDGRIAITLTGAPEGTVLTGTARHPVGRLPDASLDFALQSDGRFLSRQSLPAGRWMLRLEAQAGKDTWRAEEALQ